MIKEIIEQKIIENPWPTFIEGSSYGGTKVALSSICSQECIEKKGFEKYQCAHNLTYITKEISNIKITVGQVFLPNEHPSRYLKRNPALRERKASLESINKWFNELCLKANSLEKVVDKYAKKRLDPFHEFVKWADEIKYYAERMIRKEGFDDSPENLKSLYKTSVMLMDSLDTAALYVNPASVSFGKKRSTDLYSMIHKVTRVLSHAKGSKNRVKINIMGKVENKHQVYESFKIIPLCLIQNAIKYRKTGDVEVVFDEKGNKLDFSVVSYGDYLDESDIKNIFERGFRSKKAQAMNVDGNGLGLYALKVVADAHNFEVLVRSILKDENVSKPAKNIFTISIH